MSIKFDLTTECNNLMIVPGVFKRVLDDLILQSENDARLAACIRWIDLEFQKNMINFYEMAYSIVDKQPTNKRAHEWFKSKKNSYR